MAKMEVTFPGGAQVAANIGGFDIVTDQPEKAGGEGSAPTPFALFLSSIGTCAGIYALSFCQRRDIDTTDMKITMTTDFNKETKLIENVELKLHVPEGFPEKYEKSIIRSMNLCAVKKHLETPPNFNTVTTISHPE